MDIEKLKKMNLLTKDLQKGFALTSDEAFRQAEQIYTDQKPEKLVPSEKIAETVSVDAARYELLLEMQGAKFAKEVKILRSSLDSLSAELSSLRAQMQTLSVQKPAENPVVEIKTEKKEEVKEEPKSHPRQGNYTSEDVAIDKMFYFGNK